MSCTDALLDDRKPRRIAAAATRLEGKPGDSGLDLPGALMPTSGPNW